MRALPENIALGLQRPRKLGRYFDRGQYFLVSPHQLVVIVLKLQRNNFDRVKILKENATKICLKHNFLFILNKNIPYEFLTQKLKELF